MADGRLAAVFKGLAVDAEQAGKNIAESVASVVEKTADIEEVNVARTLAAEEENAGSFTGLAADADTVVVESGTKGNWNKLLNNPKPNATYLVDGKYTYRTDDLGRVTSSSTSLNKLAQSPARNSYQQKVAGGVDRLISDQGGHIFGAQFGGPGEAINLTAMDKVVNTGPYKQLESTWAQAVKNGDNVDVQVGIDYTGDSQRPVMYTVKSTINGVTKTHYFDN